MNIRYIQNISLHQQETNLNIDWYVEFLKKAKHRGDVQIRRTNNNPTRNSYLVQVGRLEQVDRISNIIFGFTADNKLYSQCGAGWLAYPWISIVRDSSSGGFRSLASYVAAHDPECRKYIYNCCLDAAHSILDSRAALLFSAPSEHGIGTWTDMGKVLKLHSLPEVLNKNSMRKIKFFASYKKERPKDIPPSFKIN